MSLKFKKHTILIFMVLLMLMVIPMSFASDADDAGIQGVSADDAIVAAPVDNVNTSVSASVDADDVISAGEDLIITPSPTTVDDYTPGDSKSITVKVERSGDFDYYFNYQTFYIKADINDGAYTDSTLYRSAQTASTFTYDLNKIPSQYFNEGANAVKFIITETSTLDNWGCTWNFVPLTVNVVETSEPEATSLSVDPTSLSLDVGDTSTVTPTVSPDGLTVSYSSDDESVATVDNTGLITAISPGSATITLSVGDDENYAISTATVTVTVNAAAEEEIEGDWYVSGSGNDNNNNGKTRETAFLTVYKAISSATSGDTIVVLPGTYSRSTVTTISKDITILADGDVILTRTAGAYFSSGSGSYNIVFKGLTFKDCDSTSGYGATTMPAALNMIQTGGKISIIDCTFINDKGPSIIRTRADTEIIGCVFIDDTCTGNTNSYSTTNTDGFIDFSASSGETLTMNYNLFINPIYQGSNKFIMSNGGTGNIDYNYWGSNDALTNFDSSKFTLNNWVVINSEIDSNTVEYGNDYEITVNFNSTTDGTTLGVIPQSMPDLTLDVAKKIGTVSPETVTITDNMASIGYSANAEGDEKIDFNYGSSTLSTLEFTVEEVDDGSRIYVDDSVATSGNGRKETPYKTIQEALNEKADKPIIVLEGIYSVDNQYTIGANVNITGRGNVVLTRTGSGYLFYNYPWDASTIYNITLKNVIIENITGTDIIYNAGKSVFDMDTYQSIKYYSSITIENCTIRNNVASGNLIDGYDYCNINITNTNFINNTANRLINTGSNNLKYVIVNYCNFIDNTVSKHYVYIPNYGGTYDTNYNFWGSNDGIPEYETGYSAVSQSSGNNWVIVDLSIDEPVTSLVDNNVNAKFKLNDGTELAKSMPTVTFGLSAVNGTVDEDVTLIGNEGSAIYTSSVEGLDKITLSSNDEITSIEFTVEEDETGKLFVDQSYTGGNSDGSKAKPFTTVKAALDESKNTDANQIIIYDGEYTDLSAMNTITKDIALIGRGDNVVINGLNRINMYSQITTYTYSYYNLNITGITFTGTSAGANGMFYDTGTSGDIKTIRIENCTFTDINANSLIYVTRHNIVLEKVNIIDSTFTAATTSSAAIYLGNSNPTMDISYSNFINNTLGKYLVYSLSTKVTADYNFWGSNDKPTTDLIANNVWNKVNNWVVVNATIGSDAINKDSTYDLDFKFQSTTDGITYTDLNDTMPPISFDLVSALGNTITPTTITMVDNKANATYTADNAGEEVINLTHTAFVTNLTFEVSGNAKDVVIGADDIEMTYGDDETLTATVTCDGENVEVPVAVNINGEDKDPITSSDGQITLNDLKDWAAGTYTINLTVNTAEYKGNKSVTVKINKAAPSFNADDISLYVDASETISVTDLVPGDASLTYTSNDTSIATVSAGEVTGKGEGKANITISIAETQNYTAFSKDITVTVSRLPSEIVCDSDSISIVYGEKLETGEYGDWDAAIKSNGATVWGNVVFVIADPTIVYYNDDFYNSYFKGIKVGTTTVNASYAGDEKYAPSYKIITVEVTPADASVSADDSLELDVDATGNIVATTTPGDLAVKYESNDTSVATVDENGLVTALKEGTASITVTINDSNYFANSTTVTVTVSRLPTEIVCDSDSISIVYGEKLETGEYGDWDAAIKSNGATVWGNVVFVIADPTIVYYNDEYYDSYFKGIKVGTTTINASYAGDKKYAPSYRIITVEVTPADASVSADDGLELDVDATGNIVATTDPSDLAVKYESNDTSVATVDENGLVTALKEGTASITVTINDSNYFANSTTVTVTVNKINTEININQPTISLDVLDTQNAGATLNPSEAGLLSYKSSDENVAKVDENGLITAVGKGNANITVYFNGNEKYAAAENKTISVSVELDEASVSSKDIELNVGEKTTIEVTTTPAGLNVTYDVADKTIVSVDENGTVTALKAGNTTITILIKEDGIHAVNSTTINVSVSLNDASVSVENDTLDLTVYDESSIVATTTPSGLAVNYESNDTDVATVDENGNVVAVGEGTAIIKVSVGDGVTYAVNSTTVTVTVNPKEEPVTPKEDLNVSVSADPITVGDDAVIEVSGLGDATGNVTATVNGEDYSAPIVDGVASITVPGLAENATAVVSYPGDDNYNNFTESVDIVVNPKEEPVPSKENATMDVSVDPITEGEDAIVNVVLPEDATGNVTVGNTTVPVVNGTASVPVSGLKEGNTTLPVVYSGDDKYAPAEDNITVTVNPKEEPVTPKEDLDVSVVADEITVGDDAVIEVSGLGDATGNVTATVNGEDYSAPIVDGVASITVPGLAENATAVVSYPGDDNYNNFTESVDIVVNPKEEPVPSKENATMDVSVDPITEGEDAIVNVVLPEDATGNVTVGNTTVPVVNGTASVPVSGLKEGNTTLPVIYSGDDKYAPAEDNITVTVNPKEEPVTPKEDLNVSVVADEITVGDDAVIEVSGLENATGNVTATVNGKDYTAPIVDGAASITVPGLAENATAVVSYPGDDNYNNFTESVDIVVNPKEEPVPSKENATMDVEADKAVEDENSTITVNLPKDATGNVTAVIEGNPYTAPVVNGTATIAVPGLRPGNYTAHVTYSGDDKYNPASKDIAYEVEEVDKSDIISAPDVVKYFGGSERFVVNVTDSEGNPVANKSVTIVINGQKYDRTTKADGTTSIGLSLNSGVYNATVTVDNKTINSVVTVLSTVNGTDVVKVFRNATQYYATFRDSEGNYLKEGTVVTFNINGVMYERKISGSEGLAKLNLNLEQGSYVLTAMNPETGENAANNITIIARLIENRDITKYYRNATQYTVKVIGDNGNPVGAGESVTFNINGVFYTRQTNESGIAKLNLNLQPGDYIITAEYKNCKVSNNIKVLPVLSAEDISMKYRDGTKFVAKLVDGQGKPLSGETIQFNVNGVFYNRVTGSDGQAKLNINLQAGEYIITSSYNGANIANTIAISA